MATTPPLTTEERLARLEGVYEHLATQAQIAEVKVEIAEVRVEMHARIGEVKAEIADLKAEIADLRGSMRTLFIALSAGLALLNIILRFWPS